MVTGMFAIITGSHDWNHYWQVMGMVVVTQVLLLMMVQIFIEKGLRIGNTYHMVNLDIFL